MARAPERKWTVEFTPEVAATSAHSSHSTPAAAGRLEEEDDLYLSTLARYVASFGGHIEVRAVFAEEVVTLLLLPDPADPSADPGP